jgi:tripartite-type tricarboxylate transporter receptor subunit TctC
MGGGSLASCLSYIQARTLRPLALTSKERWPQVPDTPTTAELGYPTIKTQQWTGISGPPKLPSRIVEIWEKAMEEMVKDPEVILRMKSIGTKENYLNSREVRDFVIQEGKELKILWGMK